MKLELVDSLEPVSKSRSEQDEIGAGVCQGTSESRLKQDEIGATACPMAVTAGRRVEIEIITG